MGCRKKFRLKVYMGHENEVGASSWRLKNERYKLVGEVCPHCDNKIFPPREICNNCGDFAKETYVFSGRGEIYSYTRVINPNAEDPIDKEYTIALIKLEEGPMLTARLTDIDPDNPPEIGQTVEMVTRKINNAEDVGIIKYCYAFRLPVEMEVNPKDS